MPLKTLTRTLILAGMVAGGGLARGQDLLDEGWRNPPVQARLRAYWWWLNGNVTPEAITKDLKWMKAIGMGGALVFDAGGATEGGHAPVPAGPLFGSPQWRALFTHALREADRLGLEIGLNLQSGWNLGGPLVTPDKAAKLITWSQLRELVQAGAAVVGPKPEHTTGRQDDGELKRIADELWQSGRIQPRTARQTLGALDVSPDIEGIPDWIHRRRGEAEVYFLSNQRPRTSHGDCVFRVRGKQPEFWDAVTGARRAAVAFTPVGGRTSVPLELPPYGSLFVVFRKPVTGNGVGINFERLTTVGELTGPWTVAFDPKWGGPPSVEVAELVDWTKRPEHGIQAYSGTATYRKTFNASKVAGRLFLDLGDLAMLAEVRLNGRNLGVVWFPPFRLDITSAVKPTSNVLEVDVVNGWYNRLARDLTLPESQRLTRTNIRLKPGAKPVASGLFGPVRLLTARREEAL
jgi:hypothetical protein